MLSIRDGVINITLHLDLKEGKLSPFQRADKLAEETQNIIKLTRIIGKSKIGRVFDKKTSNPFFHNS